MKKIYDPKNIETVLYNKWEKYGLFKFQDNLNKKYFCIVMPPPNITGNLHMGHAFQQTIMDILIRYNRMQGKNTLWQVGTDHAGIATQMIVERKIMLEENKTRDYYSRKDFVQKIWDWKNEINNKITNQIRRLGSSVDWDRELFTLDPNITKAVQKAFICLYKENLIYRKKTLVNWDSKLKTVISDLEIEHRSKKGNIWYIKYPFANDNKQHIIVATTRPETIFADVAVAVNPKDSRYAKLIGKKVLVPLINRVIDIITDNDIDMKKGTGCVKVTPAHNFTDYEIGLKHKLSMINIFTEDGKICANPKIFDYQSNEITSERIVIPSNLHNLDRFVARKIVISLLNDLHLIKYTFKHTSIIPYGDRTNEVIEPRLTNQWFLKVKKLANTATAAVHYNTIKIIPKQYRNMYFSWMSNIKDWCISRQLWWGHRIPVWFDSKNTIYVGKNELDIRKKFSILKNVTLVQEPDVLDTWFSSALWICTSLGWPNQKKFFKKFYPTNVLVSGFDIIFFWIARIIMLSMHFIKDKKGKPIVPFKKVYITGLIKDESGQKMSKSKGNIIDPIDVIDGISLKNLLEKRTTNMMQIKLKKQIIKKTKKEFPKGIEPIGTDALRFTFTSLASTSRDIYWDMDRLKGYRNFCNKLWNAGRFVLITIKHNTSLINIEINNLSFSNQWILIKLNNVIKSYRKSLDSYRFDLASNIMFNFVKNTFCDWYLEFSKISLNKEKKLIFNETKSVLVTVLEKILLLMHPIIPFITEFIWKKIQCLKKNKNISIMLEKFPKYKINYVDNQHIIINDMKWLQKIIIGLRKLKLELNASNLECVSIFFVKLSSYNQLIIQNHKFYLKQITKFNNIEVMYTNVVNFNSIVRIINNIEILISIKTNVNKKLELQIIIKKINKIKTSVNQITIKLLNKNFLQKAPNNIVMLEKKRLISYKITLNKLLLKQKNILKY
ncbi:valine--tRNA ligase [Buchnera aphidicola (Nipponaphis monzeni)]|uniref:Valine--tRNA ligase n=1 Tax=Buchnera aphidicola (Nipponaphis monzeni) TaxID=2495405 RepID=A0A455TAE1_9GAMM|nr:valine--tRNA ligase [Buchnera aphidicola]BBI01289.1 valine--tRNA ligase [Buchnera aphidicola (Nipponaphis monzeni)]